MGEAISGDYRDRNPLLIGVLKGGVVLLADLVRAMDIPCQVDFLRARSYGDSRITSGSVEILLDVSTDVSGRDLILVEGVVDTGYTLLEVWKHLAARGPRSIAVCTLLDKPQARKVHVELRYVGFEVDDQFVVGYGLDAGENHRQLPYIAAL
jgi:hypoxanthine phosphoribosyltransferase